ncbi:MAG TPA: ferredoxin, partial [Desulfurococcales archaeon]|nr:ferredoxin [Desulfurococcales archaeon]
NLVMALLNLGIALGSAVKTAGIHNVDNRIMYTIGYAAQRKGLMKADIIIGIPLSAKGKNIYFDRKWPK